MADEQLTDRRLFYALYIYFFQIKLQQQDTSPPPTTTDDKEGKGGGVPVVATVENIVSNHINCVLGNNNMTCPTHEYCERLLKMDRHLDSCTDGLCELCTPVRCLILERRMRRIMKLSSSATMENCTFCETNGEEG